MGIPSFVVTLALFLAWQGVLQFVVSGIPVNTTNYKLWFDMAYGNLSVTASWIFTLVLLVGYLGTRSTRRSPPSGRVSPTMPSAWWPSAA